MKVRIEIDTRTFVRFWLVVIGFALATLAIYSARTALIIIGIALFLALALSPIVNRLARILPNKKSRVLGTAIAYLAVVLALVAIVVLVVPPIVGQTAKFMQNIPGLIDSATQQYAGVNNFVEHYGLQTQFDKAIVSIKNTSVQLATGLGTNIVTGIGSVFSMVTALILVFVLTFLMLVEGPAWLNRLWSLYNNKSRMLHHRKVLTNAYNVVTNYITGQLSVAAIAGVVAGVVVLILSLVFGIPINLVIPVVAIIFVSSLIPMFGAIIGATIIIAVLLLNNFSAAVAFLIFFVVYQQVESNFISPKIQSKRINLSALVILVAVTIGVYLFGILGGIISVPIAGCIKILIDDYLEQNQDNKTVKKKHKA